MGRKKKEITENTENKVEEVADIVDNSISEEMSEEEIRSILRTIARDKNVSPDARTKALAKLCEIQGQGKTYTQYKINIIHKYPENKTPDVELKIS